MNQILEIMSNPEINNNPKRFPKIKVKFKFKLIFFISIFIIVLLIFYYAFFKYDKLKKERISKMLINQYNITTLYNSNNNYTSKFLYNEQIEKDPFVIGLIKIDKINLLYPILSETSESLLKIAPCRFCGPLPNTPGNLCIVGHNYVDNKLFSKIHLLETDDIINLYDLDGNETTYIIYKKEEIYPNDISCLNQNTNGLSLLTLITCNNVKGTRVIIHAKQVV